MLPAAIPGEKKAHLLWMTVLIGLAALGAILYYIPFERPQGLENVQPLLTGWQYFTDSDPTPKAVARLDDYIPFRVNESMTLVRQMNESVQEAHLLLRLTYNRAQVYMGDVVIFENENDPPGENPSSGVHLVELPQDYVGQELKVVCTTPYAPYAYSPDPIYIGDAASLASLVLATSARDIALLFVLVASGLALMGLAFYAVRLGWAAKIWQANFCFGLFSVLYGLSLPTLSNLYLAIYPPTLSTDVEMILWFLFPVPLTCYLWLKSTAYRRLTLAVVAYFSLTTGVVFLGVLFGLWLLPETIELANYAYIVGVVASAAAVGLEIIKGNKLFRLLAPGMGVLFAAAVLSMMNDAKNYEIKEGLRSAGTLLLVAVGVFDGIRAVVAHRRMVDRERQLVEIKSHLATEQLETADSQNQETRLLRHEIRHHLAALTVLQREGKFQEIGEHLEHLNMIEQKTKPVFYCRHGLVNAILSKASDDCERWGITFTCEGSMSANVALSDGDLCTLLMNMLENAVEAARLAPEGKRWISVQVRAKDGFLVVACRNARNGTQIMEHDGRFLSTKRNARFHGYGILAMRQIAEKHGSKLNIEYNDEFFGVKTILKLEEGE